ncbi:hypothetical protein [Mycobacterium sp.]|uniref:hypothetical protein n=1 Tax=Mycobacterium sp. TaxID=1785 RepID=UPI002CBE1D56|nr:hypothetical protein [Mycobacterium sp.]HME48510.1 hypothetical protein [Mycobacterium sp.]
MNTSAHTLRRGEAGALIAAGLTATALGAATLSHADTTTHGPHTTTGPSYSPPHPSIDGFGRGTPGHHPTPHHRNAGRH